MAIPVAPTITQTVTEAPVPADTVVADLSAPEAESYALTDDGGGLFAINGASIASVSEITAGDYTVAATATNVEGTGPATTQSLTFTAAVEEEREDDYAGNPQIPPPMAEGDEWTCFIVAATSAIRPHARNGVDYAVARPDRATPLANVAWNDTVLGPRPDAEIEEEARRLADAWPSDINPVNAV